MLEGVNILSQTTQHMGGSLGVFIIGIFVLALALFCLIAPIRELIDGNDSFVGVIFLGIGLCVLGYFMVSQYWHPNSYTEYKVTISDKVNFNEFNSKYNIIDQDGKIYTIEKR